MSRTCEVCLGLPVEKRPRVVRKRVRRLLVEGRILVLCDAHAESVRTLSPDTTQEVRTAFVEKDGLRSALDRRSPVDRRMFPPRPEGRRRAGGRRDSDAEKA